MLGGEAIIGVLNAILWVCKALTSLAAMLLGYMLRPDIYNFTSEPVILTGWKICRDICNLFFLLILLFIAFCTILQIEKYHLKKTLLTLIIMALLINFSKPIAIFIFDGSQLLMNYFLGTNTNYETTVMSLSKIAEISYNNIPGFFVRWFKWIDDSQVIAQQITTIIFIFMYAVALIIMAIYLFIRLIALWLLIIVSPFAFLAMAVPDFKKISSEWWDALFKYCYVGPVIAFFLFLSLRIANSSFVAIAQKINRNDNIITLGNAVQYVVVLVFLYASIIIAQKFGIQFASAITGQANKIIGGFAGAVSGYGAARWGARKLGEGAKYAASAGLKWGERKWLMPYGLSPRARWQGWKQRAEEVDREALEKSTGASRDQYHKWIDKARTNYESLAVDRQKAKKMKEYSEQSEDFKFLGAQMSGLVGSSAADAKEKMCGIFRIAWKNKDQDELLGYVRNNLDKKIFQDLGFTEENTRVSAKNANDAATRLLRSAGGDDRYVNKELLDLGAIAASNGGVGFGAVKWDEDKNEFVRIEKVLEPGEAPSKDHEAEANYAIRKLLTSGEAQQVPKFFHRNHFTDEGDANGDNRHLNAEGKQALWLYASNVAAIEHSGRFRPDFYRQVGADEQITDQMYDYASEMYAGTAQGYDAKKQAYGVIEDPQAKHKATLAMAWISAVQARSGVDVATIKEKIRKVCDTNKVKFDDVWKEVKKYQETGKVNLEKDEKGKGKSAPEPVAPPAEESETDPD